MSRALPPRALLLAGLALVVATVVFAAAPPRPPLTAPGGPAARPTAPVPAAAKPSAAQIRALLPAARGTVDVMGLSSSPRLQALTTKIQTAMQANRDWFVSYIQQHRGERPLPWNAKMGMSKAEYDEMNRLEAALKLVPTSHESVYVVPAAGGTFRLVARGQQLMPVNGVVVDPARNVVVTSLGTCDVFAPMTQSGAEAGVLGAWRGYSWMLQQRDPTSGDVTNAQFNLGRLAASGRGLIFFRAVKQSAKNGGGQGSLVIEYPIAAAAAASAKH